MATWFTADTHFGHANILRLGAGRPFGSVEEHDEALVARWNAAVAPRDDVWHLGDFGHGADPVRLRRIFARLRGRKRLVPGNHDKAGARGLGWLEVAEGFRRVSVDGRRFFLCHYPVLEWPGYWGGVVHLHGHTHGTVPSTRRRLDVGVDARGWAPVQAEAVLAAAKDLPDPSPRALPVPQVGDELDRRRPTAPPPA